MTPEAPFREDLKALWAAEQATAPPPAHDPDQIRQMLRQRSRHSLDRIRRHVAWEAALLTVAALASLPAWHWVALQPLVICILLLAGLGLAFYGYKYYQLQPVAGPAAALPLRQAIGRQVYLLNTYLRLYTVISLLLVPVLGAAGVLYGLWIGLAHASISLDQLSLGGWAWALGGAAAYALLAMWLARRYVWHLYGQPSQTLRSCLEELDSLDP